MQVTARQFGQLEVCCYVLEELPEERNRMAKRALNIFREILDEIRETEEMGEEFEMADLSDMAGRRDSFDAVRKYGQELIAQGAGMKEVIRILQESFDLTQRDLAAMLAITPGTLSKYLNHNRCRFCMIAAFTEFFGTDGKEIRE